jgi:fused signal recognition particle receptor
VFKRLFGRGDTPAGDSPAAVEARAESEAKIEQSLSKTRKGLMTRLAEVFGPVDITDTTWEDLEVQLIRSDVGVQTAVDIVAELREKARFVGVRRASELPELLKVVMVRVLEAPGQSARDGAAGGDGQAAGNGTAATAMVSTARSLPGTAPSASDAADGPVPQPYIVLIVGVNGSGKTTSIAKLAHAWRQAGRSIVLVAADTFRAAAIDQLKIWGERVGTPVIAGQPGGDPGAVVFDALSSGQGRAADVVVIDTAGRLHTHANLMAELVKVNHVVRRLYPDAPHATLLVLDATTGQNGLAQAKAFAEAVDVTGLVLAKLDSSAKGGVAFAVTRELGLPILYVGTGEQIDDLSPFDAAAYVDGVLGH